MFGNIGKMMKMAGEMKTKLPELKQRIAASEYTAGAGDGAVSVTVSGKMELLDLTIDQALLAGAEMDVEKLSELIKSAVAAAQQQANRAAKEAMKELTGGMDLGSLADMLG